MDAGSTFSARIESNREVQIGIDPNTCLGHAKWESDVATRPFDKLDPNATEPPEGADPGSWIGALYDPSLGFFALNVNVSYKLNSFHDACMSGQAVSESHYVGGPLGCDSLMGLSGRVTVDPSGPDQVDMACTINNPSKNGSVQVTGVLTLRD